MKKKLENGDVCDVVKKNRQTKESVYCDDGT